MIVASQKFYVKDNYETDITRERNAHFFIVLGGCSSYGLAKLGNFVAETLLRRQMFPSLAARETSFAARKQENVFALGQKHFTLLAEVSFPLYSANTTEKRPLQAG